MRRPLLAAFAALAPIAAGQLPPRAAAQLTTLGTASIGGRVVVAGTRPASPVRRARVSLTGGVLSERQFVDTDTDGRYRFDHLPSGQYRIRAEKPGLVALDYGTTRPFVHPEPVDVRDGQAVTADFALPRGAALEGRVLNETGEPLQNVIVAAIRYAYGASGRRPTSVQQARTDDLGRYRIHSLPAGEYYVESTIDPLQALNAPPDRAAGYARTYYPGTPRVNEARAVKLTAGEDAVNLDFALTSVPVATITVQILDASGKAPAIAAARLQAVGGPIGDVRCFADPRNRSSWTCRSVPPGDYWVLAAATPASPGDPEFAATRVSIAGQDQPLTVTTERGARIDGRVEIESTGAPFSFAGLQAVAHETELELPNPGGAAAPPTTIAVGVEGRFLIPSLFGPRLLRLNRLPAGWAIKGIWLGDQEITDTVTDFRASNAPHSMRMVVTNRTASVSGTVTDARARPASEYQVVVFAEDEATWIPRSRLVRDARRSAGGRFTVEGLPPGAYLICAFEPLDDESWSDPQVLRRLRSIATPLTLADGDKQTVALTLKVLP